MQPPKPATGKCTMPTPEFFSGAASRPSRSRLIPESWAANSLTNSWCLPKPGKTKSTFRPAESEEIFSALGAHPGSLGAVGVRQLPVYADERLRDAAEMSTGANEDGFHLRNVAIARDIPVKKWADLRLVQAGEPCP